jgi:two-component system chemotaxis sensor kinase CheA
VLERRIAELAYEPFSRRLARAATQARDLAERLGKAGLETSLEVDALRFHPERWNDFWAAFVHAVRNAVDHGIESPDERIALGKSPTGRLRFGVRSQSGVITVEVQDDGRGIDWDEIAQRASDAGLPSDTKQELVAALFSDGITTRDRATDISGRGAGLAALLGASRALGGSMHVESQPGRGSTLRFLFPDEARRRRASGNEGTAA